MTFRKKFLSLAEICETVYDLRVTTVRERDIDLRVAKETKEYTHDVRGHRIEQGYAIATKLTGRPDLKAGQYVLQSRERTDEPHDRKVSVSVQKAVYHRDENTCRVCGWNMTRWTEKAPRILELHHIEHHAAGGPNIEKNLIVICSKCHDEVHSGKHTKSIKKIERTL